MFRPEEMCELSLLVAHRDIEVVMRLIAKQGVLHQVDTSYLSREEDWQEGHWQDRIQEYQGIEQRLLLIMGALEVPEEAPATQQELDGGTDLADLQDRVMAIERDVLPLVNTVKEQEQRLTELEALMRRLEPLTGLDIDLGSLGRLSFLHVQIGIVPTVNLDRLNASLLHVPHVILPLGTEGAGTLIVLFGAAKDREVLERATHSAYLSEISLPEGFRGTPKKALDRLSAEVASLKQERAELDGQIVALRGKWGPLLQSLLWRVRADLVLLRAMDRLGQVRDVYLVSGWIPARIAPALVREVKEATGGRVTADITPSQQVGDAHSVPIALRNRGILRAFQGLVTTYSWPSYNEIDPTPFVAFTFSLMFGLMFGDVGHGLVLALAGILSLSGRVSKLKSFAGMAPVILISGLWAMFFGFLYGSFFGIEDLLPAIWLRPLRSIMTILLSTIAFGVVILILGFIFNMINGWIAHDWRRVLFDRYGFAGMWFYLAVIGIVLASTQGIRLPTPLTLGLVLTPVLLILFSEPLGNWVSGHRPLIHDSVGLFVIQSFFEIFEALISYLSNSLSYVRLGAFAVAHGGLSAVIFILANMVGGPSSILHWVVVALGNLFIIGFEGLIVGIQTLRLEYYEFFSKFFTGGGVPYRPLTLHSKNI